MTRATLHLGLLALLSGALAFGASSASAQSFRRFVACNDCITDFYYVDQSSGFFPQDWSCSDSTYDGHIGTDFSLINGNASIDGNHEITAAAAGTVISTEDGYYDRCTQCGGANCGYDFGNGFANQVYIDHGGYYAMYGHMKMGSVMVQPGDTVTCGQVIGYIGSAGCSTGAHVHFEPRSASTEIYVDPFAGDCSPTATSLWVGQGGHRTLPSTSCDADAPPAPTCPAGTYAIWTCNEDMSARRRCVDGEDTTEECAGGCMVMATGTDDVCALAPDGDSDGSRSDVDCDDAMAAVHPGAVDTCGDNVDQDCSGADAMCPVATGGTGAMGAAASGGSSGGGALASGGSGGVAGMVGAAGGVATGGSMSAGASGAPLGGASAAGGASGAAGATGLAGLMAMNSPAAPSSPRGCTVASGALTTNTFEALTLGLVLSWLRVRRRRR